jgi:hypothetical protein
VLDPTGGHKHNGVDGARLPFANLDVTDTAGSTPPSGGSKSYNDIANHVIMEHGVHGFLSGIYLVGSNYPDMMIQAGVSPNSTGEVWFLAPFAATQAFPHPIVIVTGLGSPTGAGGPFNTRMGYTVSSVSTTGFVYTANIDSPWQVMWIAIGPSASS